MDVTEEGVMKSFAMVEAGELARPERCKRVWLGSTDLEREVASSLLATIHPIIPQGVWRDSETNEVLDISAFWGPGQPNGVRIQNCAGIWETVRVEGLASLARTGRGRSGWMMAAVKRKGSAGTIVSWHLYPVQPVHLPPAPADHPARAVPHHPGGHLLHPPLGRTGQPALLPGLP